MTPFDGVNANTVQAALEQLQANLVRYINAVKSAEGAGRVGITPFKGVTSGTVQAALEEIRRQIDDVTAGIIPDYGVTTIKLALQAVTADRLAQDVLDMIEAAEPARSTMSWTITQWRPAALSMPVRAGTRSSSAIRLRACRS